MNYEEEINLIMLTEKDDKSKSVKLKELIESKVSNAIISTRSTTLGEVTRLNEDYIRRLESTIADFRKSIK